MNATNVMSELFPLADYNALNPAQQTALSVLDEILNGADGPLQPKSYAARPAPIPARLEETATDPDCLASAFNLLRTCQGCLPGDEIGDELLSDIRRKFACVYQAAITLAERDLVAADLRPTEDFSFHLVIDPSYEDDTNIVITDFRAKFCFLPRESKHVVRLLALWESLNPWETVNSQSSQPHPFEWTPCYLRHTTKAWNFEFSTLKELADFILQTKNFLSAGVLFYNDEAAD